MSAARYAVGLDIGSTRTRCVVCVYEDEMLRFLGHGDVPSTGWAKGRVADAVSVAESIRQAVSAAERASGVQVEGAVLADCPAIHGVAPITAGRVRSGLGVDFDVAAYFAAARAALDAARKEGSGPSA